MIYERPLTKMQKSETHLRRERRQEMMGTWNKTCRRLESWPSGWPLRHDRHRNGRSSHESLSSETKF